MTDKDAKTKWCPMVRIFKTEEGWNITNRGLRIEEDSLKCMPDNCAVWIWEEDYTHTGRIVGHCGLVKD